MQTKSGRRDKGHAAEIATFLAACRSGEQPWPVPDMAGVTRATFEIRDRLESRAAGQRESVDGAPRPPAIAASSPDPA